MRPATLLDYLQDAAAEHASILGIGLQDLHHRDLTWVLSRLRLRVERYPGVGETVLVRTWPSTRGGLSSYREFEVLDEAGAIAARATTAWVVLDLVRRRPLRIADVLPDYPLETRRAIADDTVLASCVPEAPGAPGRFLHGISRHKDGRELARLRISWA